MKKNRSLQRKVTSAPFSVQIVLLMTLLLSILLAITTVTSYRTNRRILMSEEAACANRVLALEMNSLDDYISELTSFSLQPCYDSQFMKIMATGISPSAEEIEYIKTKMSDYYYTRSDISSYCIYFLKKDMRIGRMLREQAFTATDNIPNLSDQVALSACRTSPSNIAIVPAENKGLLLTFYRTIGEIGTDEPIALVRSDVDFRDIRRILSVQLHPDEYRVLLTESGQPLYAELPTASEESFSKVLPDILRDKDDDTFRKIELNGTEYLASVQNSSRHDLRLISLIPYKNIVAPLNTLLVQTLFWGGLLWIFFISSAYLLTSYVTKPFQLFAREIDSIGTGSAGGELSIEGCYEINQLRDSFRGMELRIQTLIRQNYIARMEEQNARLSTVDSHLDPDLLYHTLSHMADAEAKMSEEEIRELSKQLASLVRYSMWGGSFVTLREEIRHAQYFSGLLQNRLGEAFSFSIQTDASGDQLLIPKLTLLNMMEYVIPKEYTYEDEIPRIQIEILRQDDRFRISIHNLSRIFTPEEQVRLKSQLADCEVPGNIPSNPLCSLYSRLLILFEKDVAVIVTNDTGAHMTISLELPIKRD